MASRGLPDDPSHRGGIRPACGEQGGTAIMVPPCPMGLFSEEQDAGGWKCCGRGCSSQVEIKKAAGGCTKPFCRFEESSLGIKMLIALQKCCKLSSYFSHLCHLLVYNFLVCAVNTDYSFSLKLFSQELVFSQELGAEPGCDHCA